MVFVLIPSFVLQNVAYMGNWLLQKSKNVFSVNI